MMYKVSAIDKNGMPKTLVTSDYAEALKFSNNGQFPIEVVATTNYTYWRLNSHD